MKSVIYSAIEAERARNRLTKEELANKIGISNKTYYNWLNGISPIPSTALIEMANMFNVSIDYLLEMDKPRNFAEEKEVV